MQQELLASQVRTGGAKGSWPPSTLWGGYGGRVYSTALATMCLEVYYRYDASRRPLRPLDRRPALRGGGAVGAV